MKVGVSVHWHSEMDRVVIHQQYRDAWTLDDYYMVTDFTQSILDTVSYPADIIINLTDSTAPRSRVLSVVNLTLARYVNGQTHTRERSTIIVSPDAGLRAILSTGSKLAPQSSKLLHWAATVDEAEALFAAGGSGLKGIIAAAGK